MSDENETEWRAVRETLGMTCRCNDESAAEADEVMAACMRQLKELGYEDPGKDFLSVIVRSLEDDLGGWWIDYVACDMWYGAGIKRYTHVNVHEPGGWLTAQGDTAEDCLATLWLRAAELAKTESVPSPGESAGSHSGTSAENPAP